jgi:hypothetical protein
MQKQAAEIAAMRVFPEGCCLYRQASLRCKKKALGHGLVVMEPKSSAILIFPMCENRVFLNSAYIKLTTGKKVKLSNSR